MGLREFPPETQSFQGLRLEIQGETAYMSAKEDTMQVHIDKYPQLRTLFWNRDQNACLEDDEAFAIYERNWRFVDVEALTADEKALLAELSERYGPLLVAS